MALSSQFERVGGRPVMGDDLGLELNHGLIAPLLASYFELLLTNQFQVLFLKSNNLYHEELLTELKGTQLISNRAS